MNDLLARLRRRMMLTCKDVNEFLVDYLDRTLADDVRQRFEKHVNGCTQCMGYLDQYRHTIEYVKEDAAELADPPPELVDMTLSFLREHLSDGREP